jgi:cytochrome P450 family 6
MSFLQVLLYFLLAVIAAVYLILKRKQSYFERHGIPHVKPSMFVGNLSGVTRTKSMGDIIKSVYNECKGKDVIAGFQMFMSSSLFITDLDLVKQILVKDFNLFVDRGVFVNEENEPLTGNLFSIEGEKWRFLRNKLSPAFTSGKIKMMYNTISDKGDGFVESIENALGGDSLDVKEFSNRFTIDVISSCAFGMESNTMKHENDEMVKVFRELLGEEGQNSLYLLLMFVFPELSKFLNLKKFAGPITKLFNDIIGNSVSYRETNDIKRNDFLNMLIQLKNNGSIDGEISTESRKLTMDEVIAQACRFPLEPSLVFLKILDTNFFHSHFLLCWK